MVMAIPRAWMLAAAVLGVAAVVAGCGAPKPPGASRDQPADPNRVASITNTDPCAGRLHDLSGALLMYYLTNRRLPERLDELKSLPGSEHAIELVCPVSKRPYLYNRVGIFDPQKNTRIVIYDAAPSHSGLRWGISIVEPTDGGALVTKVIVLPESYFLMHPPAK